MLVAIFTLCGFMALTSCTSNEDNVAETETDGLRDGEWTGIGEGRSGNIIAKSVVVDGRIDQAIVVSQSESVFAQDAINTILNHAVGRQDMMSVEVDGVTGATLTSTGVVDAINMAMMAAMGKQTSTAQTYKDGSCDIVVVGAGGAGLSAAVAAAEVGDLKIVVLEKQGIIGGNTNYSTGGINAAETDVQKELGIVDSKQLFYDDIIRGGKNENIPSLIWNFVDHAPATISWLTTMGADLSDVGLMGGSSVKRTHRPKGGTAIGLARYNAQQKAGVDEDFSRSATEMTAALETAPFYAVRVKPAIHHTMGGLSVDTETRVLKADGSPIPGLYAAGEVTGGLHGANRLGGNGVADIVVNGRLAGRAAALY